MKIGDRAAVPSVMTALRMFGREELIASIQWPRPIVCSRSMAAMDKHPHGRSWPTPAKAAPKRCARRPAIQRYRAAEPTAPAPRQAKRKSPGWESKGAPPGTPAGFRDLAASAKAKIFAATSRFRALSGVSPT